MFRVGFRTTCVASASLGTLLWHFRPLVTPAAPGVNRQHAGLAHDLAIIAPGEEWHVRAPARWAVAAPSREPLPDVFALAFAALARRTRGAWKRHRIGVAGARRALAKISVLAQAIARLTLAATVGGVGHGEAFANRSSEPATGMHFGRSFASSPSRVSHTSRLTTHLWPGSRDRRNPARHPQCSHLRSQVKRGRAMLSPASHRSSIQLWWDGFTTPPPRAGRAARPRHGGRRCGPRSRPYRTWAGRPLGGR